ncbi:MAG: DNA replication/repair protein RecF [Gammaproteobacteria bacterium]|nr:DNA replication/repair protein RecF [Gammaproteobacteria bacterium]
MKLSSISISNVRNINHLDIEFGQRFNIFYGENGAGKSSILEAIYLLSTGKSFRSHQIKKIISHEASEITLFARVEDDEGIQSALGFRKSASDSEIRINGENTKSIAELAVRLPVLITTQDSHKLIDAGPQWRRQFLDWGLFHVKHEFHTIWKNYRKLLKQRNTALSQQASAEEIAIWDISLVETGIKYDQLRQAFIHEFTPYFIEFSRYLLGENEYNLEYSRGWPKAYDYAEAMARNLDNDRNYRRTEYGPHRADLRLMFNSQNSRDTASRGQQKLLVYALNLALIAYLQDTKGIKTLMLLDDLGSELDPNHANQLLSLLWERFSQVCITTANLGTLPLNEYTDTKLFHVKHGGIEVN